MQIRMLYETFYHDEKCDINKVLYGKLNFKCKVISDSAPTYNLSYTYFHYS